MATYDYPSRWTDDNSETWRPALSALQIDPIDQGSPDRPASVVVQHPTIPFRRRLDVGNKGEIRTAGLAYLETVIPILNGVVNDETFEQLDVWLGQLKNDEPLREKRFGWVSFDDEQDGDPPFASLRIEHIDGGPSERRDETIVLLASETLNGEVQGAEFGLRIIAQVEQENGEPVGLRFTGFAGALPFGVYRDRPVASPVVFEIEEMLRTFSALLAGPLHLKLASIFFCGFRIAEADGGFQVEVNGRGLDDDSPYAIIAVFTINTDGSNPVLLSASRGEMVGDAAEGEAHVFKRDPASQRTVRHDDDDLTERRPTRYDPSPAAGGLNDYREAIDIPTISADPNTPLKKDRPPKPRLFEVKTSRFIRAERTDNAVKHVHLPLDNGVDFRPRLRSHDFSAVSAFHAVNAVFDHIIDLGIDIDDYFKEAQLPLEVFYRSGVSPGPGKNGITVNARVLPKNWDPHHIGPRCDNPHLELHLAMANLSHRERVVWNRVDRSQAEYMGIGADPRWIWHEFGHVLLMASIGALELPFAHSPGDALAAIAEDPDSELATDGSQPRARGATFPWVALNRRHDRNVLLGWSWSGSQQRGVRTLPDAKRWRHKGYWSEQILSSSLFRMYRCLGGDSLVDGQVDQPDRDARAFASDYSLFLILRALNQLGCECLVPALTPEHLVISLIGVDIVTEQFTGRPPASLVRIGGCAHKVIRWAFEAQGLYPADSTVNTNAPGRPPAVDIYVADRRPDDEVLSDGRVQHGPGSYVPVSLHWPTSAAEFPNALWTAVGIEVSGAQLSVRVSNRGHEDALNVSVKLWQHDFDEGGSQPNWLDGSWVEIDGIPIGEEKTVHPGESENFAFELPVAPGNGGNHVLVFAEVTCNDDRANTYVDPAIPADTGLPCSREPTPIVDLVSGDNNLGLALIEVS